jgi:hypothetical protein
MGLYVGQNIHMAKELFTWSCFVGTKCEAGSMILCIEISPTVLHYSVKLHYFPSDYSIIVNEGCSSSNNNLLEIRDLSNFGVLLTGFDIYYAQ